MDTNIKELEKILAEINSDAEEMRNKKIEVKDSDLPSNLKIMLSGVEDNKALQFLFSNNIDKLIDQMLMLVATGNIEKLLGNEDAINSFFKNLGFGEGSFSGNVSKMVMKSMQNSVNSAKFAKTNSNLKKALLIMKNLERAKKGFTDKKQIKKYEDAIYAIKKVFRIVAKIYKNRKLVNNRVLRGLSNVVNESDEEIVHLEKII